MATVVSLTEAKIQELMAGWAEVGLSQDQINSLVGQLVVNVQSQGADLENFNEVVLPAIEADVAAGSIAVSDVTTNLIPSIEVALADNTLAIENLNTSVVPFLQSELTSANNWILELNETTLPDLSTRLEAVEAGGGGGFDPTALQAEIDALEARFPVGTVDISDGAVTADKVEADSITAVHLAAGTITALEIAANTITANEIAGRTITAAEIFGGTITAFEIAADTITANEIAADTITANELAAESITTLQLSADLAVLREVAAQRLSAAYTVTGELSVGPNIRINPIEGIVVEHGDGRLTKLPADGSPSVFDGDITTDDISIAGGLSLTGETNNMAGSLKLGKGIGAPTGPPTSSAASPDALYTGYPGLAGFTLAPDEQHWVGAEAILTESTSSYRLVAFSRTDGQVPTTTGASVAVHHLYVNQLQRVGNYIYVLEHETNRYGLRVRQFDATTLDPTGVSWVATNYAGSPISSALVSGGIMGNSGMRASLATDGTYLYVIYARSATSGGFEDRRINIIKYSTAGIYQSNVLTPYTAPAYANLATFASGVNYAWYGDYEGAGTSVLWFSRLVQQGADYVTVRSAVNFTTGAEETARTLPELGYITFGPDPVTGLFYQYGGGYFGSHIMELTGSNQDLPIDVAVSWYDSDTTGGTHETQVGPRLSTVIEAGAVCRLTLPTLPVYGGVDDPDSVGIYAGSPGGTLRLVAHVPVSPWYSTSYAFEELPEVTQPEPPTTNGFENVIRPGRLLSEASDADGPTIDLAGDNSWRVGPFVGTRGDGNVRGTIVEARRLESELSDIEGPRWYLRGEGGGRMGPYEWGDGGNVLRAPFPTLIAARFSRGDAAQNVGTAWTDVLLNATDYEYGGEISLASFTEVEVTEAGVYVVSAYVHWSNGTAGRRAMKITSGGIMITGYEASATTLGANWTTTGESYLAAGSTLKVQAIQSGQTSLSLANTFSPAYLTVRRVS